MNKKIKDIFNMLNSKELGILPSSLAYSFVIALIPIISIVFYIITASHISSSFIMDFFERTFPSGVVKLIQPVFIENLSVSSLITFIIGLFVATGGCNSIIKASNTIYNVNNASYIKRLAKALILTVILMFLIAFMFFIPLFGNKIIELLGILGLTKNEVIVNSLSFVLRVPAALLFVYVLIKLMYIIAPDIKVPGNSVTVGALFTTFSWVIITVVFSFYINNIARYDLVYGNLANLVIIMLWFYLLAYALVLGMIINKEKINKELDNTNKIALSELHKKVKKNS